MVTAIELPEDVDGAKLPGVLRKLGITANGGQNQLKGKILRIAHCGYFGAFDILTSLSGLEMALVAARPRGRARRRRRRGPARVRGRRRPGRGMTLPSRSASSSRRRSPSPASTRCASRTSTSTSGSTGATTSSPSASARYHGILIRSATKLDRRADRARRQPAGDRPRRRGRRQRRRPRRDQARDRRRQRAPVQHGHRRRAHRGADARAGPQHPAGARVAARRASGSARSSAASRSTTRRSASLGFGRIGQLVADPRARLRHARRRLRPVRGRRALPRARRRPRGDLGRPLRPGRLHHDPPAQDARDRGLARRRRLREDARTACASSTCARGPLVVDEDLQAALDSGKVAGAALDVFRTEPITDHPLFGYPNVVVTPHLGASTAEAQDRAGVQTAEQVVAALTGGVVSTAVNIPAVRAEDMEVLGPVPAAVRAARPHRRGPGRGRVDRARRGRVPRPPRRARHAPAHARGAQRRAGRPHRGGGQPRQRARRWPRSAASRSPRPRSRSRATSPTSSA